MEDLSIELTGDWINKNWDKFAEIFDAVVNIPGSTKLLKYVPSKDLLQAIYEFTSLTWEQIVKRYVVLKGYIINSTRVFGGKTTLEMTAPKKYILEDYTKGWIPEDEDDVWLILSGNENIIKQDWFIQLMEYAGKSTGQQASVELRYITTGLWQLHLKLNAHSGGYQKVIEKFIEYCNDGGSPKRKTQNDTRAIKVLPPTIKDVRIALFAGKVTPE